MVILAVLDLLGQERYFLFQVLMLLLGIIMLMCLCDVYALYGGPCKVVPFELLERLHHRPRNSLS